MTTIKIILLGESGVGKSTILLRYKTGEFKAEGTIKPTIGAGFQVEKLVLEGKEISLFKWDTAGEERHRCVTRSYYRQGEGVLLVYDVTNPESFYKLSDWLRDLRDINETAEILIAGNKNEDASRNAVAISAVKSFAREEKLEYMEMSAKSGKNVEEAFLRLAKKILIAKGILPQETDRTEARNQNSSSSENGSLSKITPKKSDPDKDHDIIRLEETPMTTKKEEKACC